MEIRDDLNDVKKLWWLHDSYWHATAVRELGEEHAATSSTSQPMSCFSEDTP